MKKAAYTSYYTPDSAFEDYGPAYRFARETCPQHLGESFEEVQSELERMWRHRDGGRKHPAMSWEKALPAVRRVWYRMQECSLH